MYKRNWVVRGTKNGFEMKLFLYGTEEELVDYLKTEVTSTVFDHYWYSGATEEEVAAAKALRLKVYMI